MRLFVRVEGQSPFALILQDNLLPEHYIEIAQQYYKENWRLARAQPELVLVRRLVFQNRDQLLDFKKKAPAKAITPAAAAVAVEPKRPVSRLYDSTYQPERILQEMTVTNPAVASMVAYCESELVIKSSTLDRLVLKITDPASPPFVEEVFWDTYRAFTKPAEVLDKLVERYEVPELVRIAEAERSPLDVQYYAELRLRARLKVVQCLEHWIEKYYFDFSEDPVYHTLRRWVKEKIDYDGIPTRLVKLMKDGDRSALKMRRPRPVPGLQVLQRELPPPTALLTKYHPREIATQLTLLTQYIHNGIYPCELLGKQWEGPEAANAPNFVAYRDFINKVSNWVTFTVVSERDQAIRANNIGVLLVLCDELLKLNNFDMLVAVHGGLTDPPVARLSQTHAALANEVLPLAAKFEELLNTRGSSKTLKAAMAASPRPHFPSIVVHLRELIHLEEQPAVIDGMVNFTRCIHQHNLVRYLLDGKNARLDDYAPNPEIQGTFMIWRPVDDEHLAKCSLECQHS